VIVGALLPLLLRRRFPLTTLVIIAAVIGISGSVGAILSFDPSPAGFFGLLFATFNATAEGGRNKGWAALALAGLATTLELRPWITPVAAWLPNYLPLVVAFVAGKLQQQRRELTRILEERIIDWQAHGARLRELSLQDARAGLARELRSVVVGALQKMKGHAEDALQRLSPPVGDPGPVLEETEAAGRTALSEMRVLLEVLRRGASVPNDGEPTGAAAMLALPSVRQPSKFVRLRWAGWQVDTALVVAGCIGVLLEFRFWEKLIGPGVPAVTFSTAAHLWALAWVLLLFGRRKAPVATGVAMGVMAFLQTYPFRYWTPVTDIYALQIAVYTIGSLKPRRPHAWVIAVLGAIGLVSIPPPPVTLSVIGFLAIMAVTLGGAAYVGTIVGERRRLNAELDERLGVLEEERRTEIALALHKERLGLAREMHDLVAHSLTLMVVQAGAARTVAATDPVAARGAVGTVIDAGQQAMAELDQLLSLLGDGGAEKIPPPTRRDVEQLISDAQRSGLDVKLERMGSHPLPEGSSLELSAYRIVQESLTNIRKHAPGSSVRVHMLTEPGGVEVRIENDGPPDEPRDLSDYGAGHGLVGMRERVAMFGGRLEAGPRPSGGFLVDAVMRLERTATT